MVSKLRSQRIAERIREELSEMLLNVVTDPRILGISITGVEVDRELAYADIFVSAIEGSERKEEVLAGLNHARGFLRRELALRIDLRVFPRLRFRWDPTPERAARIDELIESLHRPSDAEGEADQDEEGVS